MVRLITCFALLLTSTACFADHHKAPPESEDMEVIFNGKNLDGWSGDSRLWSVRDGVIHGETTPAEKANGNTFLIWQGGTLKDFELRLSFRCTTSNNSGIQYRSKHITEGKPRNKWIVRGYQHEIRNEENFPNVPGFIYDEGGYTGKRGRICMVGEEAIWEKGAKKILRDDLIDQKGFQDLMKVDEWNEVVIIAKGRQIRHYLNGKLILDFTDHPDNALTEGVLALQLHAGKPMWAEFKDVRVRNLD
ncbi:MAG: DUF1080 domain-containing protein [Rubripirellula sp.]|nr:DUF1080 domain-containing protein [Rubripirellula sp.]